MNPWAAFALGVSMMGLLISIRDGNGFVVLLCITAITLVLTSERLAHPAPGQRETDEEGRAR